jgi:uncharacterized membrane protein
MTAYAAIFVIVVAVLGVCVDRYVEKKFTINDEDVK